MPELETKTKLVTIRLKPSELAHLDECAKAVNLSRSAYIYRKISGLPILPAKVPLINWKLYKELADIALVLSYFAHNLNQLIQLLNTSKTGHIISHFLPYCEDLKGAIILIKEIEILLKQVRLELAGVKPIEENIFKSNN